MHSLSVHWENSACILCITVKPLLVEGIAVTMVTEILLIFFSLLYLKYYLCVSSLDKHIQRMFPKNLEGEIKITLAGGANHN